MGRPKYCIQCDSIRVKLIKGGWGKGDDRTVLEFVSNGEIVRTQILPYCFTDTLTIDVECFLKTEEDPPKHYTVEDLMKMLAEKKG